MTFRRDMGNVPHGFGLRHGTIPPDEASKRSRARQCVVPVGVRRGYGRQYCTAPHVGGAVRSAPIAAQPGEVRLPHRRRGLDESACSCEGDRLAS